jgi:TetR/AcrR family transcriptional regulator
MAQKSLDRFGQSHYNDLDRSGQDFILKRINQLDPFNKLPHEKQSAILNAAYTLFAKNGYDKTSMGNIASAAGIPKASLFYYFGTKKKLYLYIYDFSIDTVGNAVAEEWVHISDDFFECIKQAQIIKLKVISKYTGILDFLLTCANETSPDIQNEIVKSKRRKNEKVFSILFQKVNWNKFKVGLEPKMIMNFLTWATDGYIRESINHKSIDEMLKEMSDYMELLKIAFYKEEL